MSSSQDPIRLASESGASPWLRSALSTARAETPSVDSVERLTLRVEAAIVADLPGPDFAAPAKAHIAPLSAGKVAIAGIGIAIGVVAGTVWQLRHAAPPVSGPVSTSAAPAVPMIPARSAPAASIASVVPLVESNDVPAQPAKRPAPASTVNERDARNLNEAALLDSARSALQSDPRRALSLTQEHAKRFPRSPLVQEREVIAIQALNSLGQSTAAKARAENFTRLYPGSAHQQKIDQSLRGK